MPGLRHFSPQVIVPKLKGEPLGVVIVESGWGSMVPTVVLANMSPAGAAARCGQLNIGDQIMSINGISLVGLPLSACQNYVKVTSSEFLSFCCWSSGEWETSILNVRENASDSGDVGCLTITPLLKTRAQFATAWSVVNGWMELKILFIALSHRVARWRDVFRLLREKQLLPVKIDFSKLDLKPRKTRRHMSSI